MHLYSELDVSFIDDGTNDNIGTDRTALQDTVITKKLFEVVEALMKSYATLYDADEKSIKEAQKDEIKATRSYQIAENSIKGVKDKKVRDELNDLLAIKVEKSVQNNSAEVDNITGFEKVINSVITTYSIPTEQVYKRDVKDNINTSYDHLIKHLKDKYNYSNNDGSTLFNHIYGTNYQNRALLEALIDELPSETKNNARNSLREMGQSIVKIRNCIQHTNDRSCINDNISIENSKRFVVMIDLFIEIDKLCFKENSQTNAQQS